MIVKPIQNDQYLIIDQNGQKLGTLSKEKRGWMFLQKGNKIDISSLADAKNFFDFSKNIPSIKNIDSVQKVNNNYFIYDYPCVAEPYEPVYNIKKKLPIYAKSDKSKSLYCAGYYLIKFRKGWVKSYNPKLITLDRYPYKGPFKTEKEMKEMLSNINKYETN